MTEDRASAAATVRGLLHTADPAALATAAAPDPGGPGGGAPDSDSLGAGAPYASLVRPAPDWCGRPLLLLSDLAAHTRNVAADGRVCLLVDATAGWREPLAAPRASVMGRLARADTPELRGRYRRYHPGADRYMALADFRLYRLEPVQVHLVAGFGRIAWIAADAVLDATGDAAALIAAEAELVAHMNDHHADALRDIAVGLLQAPADAVPGDWRLAGVDPSGADLMPARGPGRRRLVFGTRAPDPARCRGELVRAAERGRGDPAAGAR